MTIDATFWVAISFLIFIILLVYFKIPLKIKNILDENINQIKKQVEESEKLKEEAKKQLAEYEKKIGDAIMYFTPPNLRPIVRGIGAFAPFQNIPNLAPVIEDPSLENIGKVNIFVGSSSVELSTLISSE